MKAQHSHPSPNTYCEEEAGEKDEDKEEEKPEDEVRMSNTYLK